MDNRTEQPQASEGRNPRSMPAPPVPEMAKKGGWWRPVVLVAALIAILVLARVFGIGEKLGALRGWIESLGPWGPLVFLLIYIAAVVAALPGAAITVAAGALSGRWWV